VCDEQLGHPLSVDRRRLSEAGHAGVGQDDPGSAPVVRA
jgi:hypothetical protein